MKSQFPPGLKLYSEWSNDQPSSSKYRLERAHGTVRTQLRSDHCQGWSELHMATFLQQWEQKLSLGNTGGPPCNPTKCSTATRANPSYHFIGITLMRQSDNIKLHCLTSWWCAKQPLRAWEEKLCLSFCYTIFAVVSQSLWLGFMGTEPTEQRRKALRLRPQSFLTLVLNNMESSSHHRCNSPFNV